ncbi:MAG TPA: hypothetical protein VFJ06_13745 [Halococcus sp.]|nr:hypothetical protein [Halococcus sp.]
MAVADEYFAHTSVRELTVEATLDTDREAPYRAVELDTLTAAMLTLLEVHAMTEELIEANGAYLPELH